MHELPKPLQVYVVESSSIIRHLLASTVEAAGGQMIGYSAEAGRAIDDLSVLKADLIIVDLSLKSGSGFDVLEALQSRQLRRSTIRIVLTNHVSERFRTLAFGLGANGFFDKASQTSEVLALIHALAKEKGAKISAGPRGPRADPGGPRGDPAQESGKPGGELRGPPTH